MTGGSSRCSPFRSPNATNATCFAPNWSDSGSAPRLPASGSPRRICTSRRPRCCADSGRQWWDLDELESLYLEFLAEHNPTRYRWQRRRKVGERNAFVDYVRLLTDWRRLPYLDPGLPTELLPPNWVGLRAADLFFTLQARLVDAARAHVERTTAN
ncbi:PaaX-like protein C-terminal domain-containing protein [Amycolatopsis marina]|uniref:PaaX-like protein C-terminal domain-containing protein n=1 Tax=Amycolatopsis marina TaxID=490629 RepID=A0A1I1AT24_9PSEU|nr:PaaX-like protein C-terminal domain-containing protein [Amycolatopsis marina]